MLLPHVYQNRSYHNVEKHGQGWLFELHLLTKMILPVHLEAKKEGSADDIILILRIFHN